MIVAKFGGTSMAEAGQIKKACAIMLADQRRKIMVVSAPGKRFSGDVKLTDLLIGLAAAAIGGEDLALKTEEVINRFKEITEALNLSRGVLSQIKDDINSRLLKTKLGRERFLDLMKAAGEDNCAKIVAAYLSSTGVKARYVNPCDAGMLLSDESGNAHILPEAYGLLHKLVLEDGIIVFPGFFGCTAGGDVVTFSRGGSDITGAILAAAINAEVYENFTDVDNVYAANPKIVENPVAVSEITYWQMRELAYAGFEIFHEEAVEPVVKARIPIHIKNTNNPSAAGTRIVFSRQPTRAGVTAIAGTRGFCNLTITKFLMNREIGFGRKLFQILEEEKISFDHAPSGIDNISPILRQNQLNADKLQVLTDRIKNELNVDSVELTGDIALIVIVNETVYSTKATAVRAVKCLAAKGIDIIVLNMGSNSLSLTVGIAENNLDKALKTIYSEFFTQD